MERPTRRTLVIVVLLLAAVFILLLVRCTGPKPAVVPKAATASSAETVTVQSEKGSAPAEVLTAASVKVPAEVAAGATFEAAWTGPDNPGDYLTIVRPTATPAEYENYRETRQGTPLGLTAPIEAGEWEVRYVTARSKTVLGRTRLKVIATSAALTAADEVVAGAPISITWTGPNNAGDFICIAPRGAADEYVGNHGDVRAGSPLSIAAPVDAGEAEIRYVSGQGRKVLGRRKLVVLAPDTSLSAQAQVTAGAKFAVTWNGPANAGDYITVVPRGTPDGQYRNYTDTAKGSPLELTAPMEIGAAEIRYMTGSRARVLARRSIEIVAADVSLSAPEQTVAGTPVKVVWSGPNNPNDYLTIVPTSTPDGQYGNYMNTAKGSPLTVSAPMRTGPAEIRYMSGQGAKVLARRPLAIVPAQISLQAPDDAVAGSVVLVEWKGPNNPGDYLTIVPKSAKDGVALQSVTTARGTPAKFTLPKETGPFEIRYMSGQGNRVLARTGIQLR
jgi:Ca-activated chloride channel family protein